MLRLGVLGDETLAHCKDDAMQKVMADVFPSYLRLFQPN
jgi:hypothetical protein